MKLNLFILFLMIVVFCVFASGASYALEDFKFKDADIQIVLQAIAQKAVLDTDSEGNVTRRVNVIVSPDVRGMVTVNLAQVDWLAALEGILNAYGYGYEWVKDDLILVSTLEDLAERREKGAIAAQQEPLEVVTYSLKYLDANDAMGVIESQLTPRGKVSVLQIASIQKWKARAGYSAVDETSTEIAQREEGARPRASKLIITETKSNMRKIIEALQSIDVMPKQVLIKAKIMEVNRDTLEDIGFEWGTGSTGATGDSASILGANSKNSHGMGGRISGNVEPSIFGPKATDITGTSPYSAGLEFIYRKFTGAQFEAVLHALEEDVDTNTLSAPQVLVLDGQEAYIIVGDKRPIIKSKLDSSEGTVAIEKNLHYYQNLGVELNVVPQVSDDGYINMVLYPTVTTSSEDYVATSSISSGGETSETEDYYPILNVRETQTQVIVKDGETIVIGGLLKDVKSESVIKTPILSDIPLLGLLFQRKTWDTQKIDLLIFITAHIIDPSEILPQAFVDVNPVAANFKSEAEPNVSMGSSGAFSDED
jgi:type IV pilus assembly protein PilQ